MLIVDVAARAQMPEKYPMSTDLHLAFCPRYNNRKRMLSDMKKVRGPTPPAP
jgi:hypothetical protein